MLHSLLAKHTWYSVCCQRNAAPYYWNPGQGSHTSKWNTFHLSELLLKELKNDERKQRNCPINDLNPRSNKNCLTSFLQSKSETNPNVFFFFFKKKAWIESVIQVKRMWIPCHGSLKLKHTWGYQKNHETVLKGRMGKTGMKVREEKTFKVTLALFHDGYKTFQCTVLQHIHSSN